MSFIAAINHVWAASAQPPRRVLAELKARPGRRCPQLNSQQPPQWARLRVRQTPWIFSDARAAFYSSVHVNQSFLTNFLVLLPCKGLLGEVLCKYNWIDWYVSEGEEWQRTEDKTQQPVLPEEKVHRCFCRWEHILTPNWMWQTGFCLDWRLKGFCHWAFGLTEKPDPNPAVFVCPHRTFVPYSCLCCFNIRNS